MKTTIELVLSFTVIGWEKDAKVKPVEGWTINPAYDYTLSKSFVFETKSEAYKMAEDLRLEYWNKATLGENEVSEYSLSMYENGSMQSFYFTRFKPLSK